MSTAIQPLVTDLTASKYGSMEDFLLVAGSTFLPRLQLMQAGSKPVQQGKANVGTYLLIRGQELTDMTKEVIVLPLSWRPLALEINEAKGEVISSYNPKAPEFKRIAAKSAEQNSGCQFGPQFLIWLPGVRLFATFFMGSPTARNEAPQLVPLVGYGALLRSTMISGKKFSWQGPVITPYSQSMELPPEEDKSLQLQQFNNPPEKEVETAEPGGEVQADGQVAQERDR